MAEEIEKLSDCKSSGSAAPLVNFTVSEAAPLPPAANVTLTFIPVIAAAFARTA